MRFSELVGQEVVAEEMVVEEVEEEGIQDEVVEEEVDEEKVVTKKDAVVERVDRIAKARDVALKGQGKQAKKMLKKNKKIINNFKIGDLVLLATDGIDGGAADAPNILCYILVKKDITFRLGCQVGILNNWFAFKQLQKTELATTFAI